MSFIKKSLASVGIGSATVDAVLNADRTCPGEAITGVVHIQAGDTAQTIDSISVALLTQYKRDVDDQDVYVAHVLDQADVGEAFEVAPQEKQELPFTLPVPLETPLTVGQTQVWVQTTLAIPRSVDPQGRAELHIEPTNGLAAALDGFEQLGFTLRQADCEQNRMLDRETPFVQQFEFVPGGEYAGRLTELEAIIALQPEGVEVWIEADLRTGGLAGMLLGEFDLNERFARAHIDLATLSQGSAAVACELGQVIDSRLNAAS